MDGHCHLRVDTMLRDLRALRGFSLSSPSGRRHRVSASVSPRVRPGPAARRQSLSLARRPKTEGVAVERSLGDMRDFRLRSPVDLAAIYSARSVAHRRTADDVPPVFVAATMQILRTRLIRRLARRRTSLSHHLGQLPHVSVPAGRVAGNCKGARMLRVAHRSAQNSR
jgi:hypothetical protein